MSLDDLARRLNALEKVDKHPFQRTARVLQSLWRERYGYPIGSHSGRDIGNYLQMPWAEQTRVNFLDDEIRSVVRREVDDAVRSRGKLFGRPRLYENLLSSQPLAFNLFAHLALDLDLASKLVARMTADAMTQVTAVEFEHSPSRSDPRYTNDRSAFDVYLRTRDRSGSASFIGIEVKYHEDLAGQGSGHQARYDAIADIMTCFRPESAAVLRGNPCQQIWRDHLLAGIHAHVDHMDSGLFVVIAPHANLPCQEAITLYRSCLTHERSFQAWNLEAVVDAIDCLGKHAWTAQFRERYLDFAAVRAAAER